MPCVFGFHDGFELYIDTVLKGSTNRGDYPRPLRVALRHLPFPGLLSTHAFDEGQTYLLFCNKLDTNLLSTAWYEQAKERGALPAPEYANLNMQGSHWQVPHQDFQRFRYLSLNESIHLLLLESVRMRLEDAKAMSTYVEAILENEKRVREYNAYKLAADRLPEGIIFPEIIFEQATLSEAVEFLNEHMPSEPTQHPPIIITISPAITSVLDRITLRARDISLNSVARILSDLTDTSIEVNGNSLNFVPSSLAPKRPEFQLPR